MSGTTTAERPGQVTIGFWLFVAGAAVALVGMIVGLANLPAARQAAEKQFAGQDLAPGFLDGVFATAAVVGVTSALTAIVVYVVFGLLARRGAGWARWVLAVFALIALTGIPYGAIGILQFVLAAGGAVMLFLPSSAEWYRQERAARAARRGTVAG